ncbi:MAG: hydrogenase formation protein HypD [Endomicrobiaceae bacterium]|nr:hydrogenase formation protein HypD [Endomicrobiaceae bacterium]
MQKIKQARFMEVCGTHTFALSKFAMKNFYFEKIDFLSGPGCPVCVTSQEDIDYIIELAKNDDNIIVSFGDMMRVPSSDNNISLDKLQKNNIKTVYSVLDILNIAVENPDKNVIFLAVGFETTAPLIAGIILDAQERKIKNFYIFSMLKTIIPALNQLLSKKQIKVDGFILPGHVCTVIGYKPFEFIVEKYKIPCVVAGFEFDDLKIAVDSLYDLYVNKKVKLLNCYPATVKENGNIKALKTIYDVFVEDDAKWRGLGNIDNSGLKLSKNYSRFDILNKFAKKNMRSKKSISKCICGKLFIGKYKPNQCPSFAKECTPLTPIGPCMVSSEGVCASYYKYGEANAK